MIVHFATPDKVEELDRKLHAGLALLDPEHFSGFRRKLNREKPEDSGAPKYGSFRLVVVALLDEQASLVTRIFSMISVVVGYEEQQPPMTLSVFVVV